MARASGVWVVKPAYPGPDKVLGVFTVKHELATWLGWQEFPTNYLITRYQDGNLRYEGTQWEEKPKRVPINEFTKLPEYKRAWIEREGQRNVQLEFDVLTP